MQIIMQPVSLLLAAVVLVTLIKIFNDLYEISIVHRRKNALLSNMNPKNTVDISYVVVLSNNFDKHTIYKILNEMSHLLSSGVEMLVIVDNPEQLGSLRYFRKLCARPELVRIINNENHQQLSKILVRYARKDYVMHLPLCSVEADRSVIKKAVKHLNDNCDIDAVVFNAQPRAGINLAQTINTLKQMLYSSLLPIITKFKLPSMNYFVIFKKSSLNKKYFKQKKQYLASAKIYYTYSAPDKMRFKNISFCVSFVLLIMLFLVAAQSYNSGWLFVLQCCVILGIVITLFMQMKYKKYEIAERISLLLASTFTICLLPVMLGSSLYELIKYKNVVKLAK